MMLRMLLTVYTTHALHEAYRDSYRASRYDSCIACITKITDSTRIAYSTRSTCIQALYTVRSQGEPQFQISTSNPKGECIKSLGSILEKGSGEWQNQIAQVTLCLHRDRPSRKPQNPSIIP